MPGYATVQIAGIDLIDPSSTPCKCYVLDGANLLSTATASNQFAADGTVHTQAFEPEAGAAIGIRAEFLPPDKLNAVVAAVMAAIGGGNSVSLIATDDIHSINADVVPDFGAGWLKYPQQRTHPEVIKEVEFRFLTV